MKNTLIIIIVFIALFVGYSIAVTPSYTTLDIAHAIGEAKTTLKDNQKIVVFDSKNPFNFYDVFHRMENIADQQVYGILTKPDTSGIYPVVIGVAGSVGWGRHHYGYLDRYLDMGFAVLSLHSFKSRSVESL